jgi:hypothetical protein
LLQAMAGWLRAYRDEGIANAVVIGAIFTVVASTAASVGGSTARIVLAYALSSTLIALPLGFGYFRRFRHVQRAG